MTDDTSQSQPTYPQLRLDFYQTAVVMSQWHDNGRQTTYPVSVHDVVSACTHISLSSGLLSANTLFWKQRGNQTSLGIYVPASRWQVQTAERHYHIPMPPFVFVGDGASYSVFAVKKRPSSEHNRLYLAPCPNVFSGGHICQGNTPFPSCNAQTIQRAFQLFIEDSLFNADLSQEKCQSYPEDVRQLWAKLDGRKRFPLSELIPANISLRNLL